MLRRKVVVGGVAGVAVVAAATSAWALTTSGSSTAYRIAAVNRGTVVQTLTTTGAVSPITSSDLDFQVAGTVGRVLVKAGEHVKAGQEVARLDRSALRAAVTSARATVADARATLASDEASQTASTTTGSTSPSRGNGTGGAGATPTTTPTSTGRPSPKAGAASVTIRRDQNAVLAAQHRADQDLATARTALKVATTACADEVDPSTSGNDGTSGSGTSSPDLSACTEATKTVLADQNTVSTDQDAVATAETTLDRDLSAAADNPSTATASAADHDATTQAAPASVAKAAVIARPTPAPSNTTTPTRSNGSSQTVTASHLASDQAAIDTDRAALATAVADLAQSVLTSPITGTVKAITISKGDSVSGTSSSTSPAIEIIGSKQSKVSIDLSAAQVRSIRIGMTARVIPDGTQSAVAGHVIAIGLTATSSDTGSDTYPVDIALSVHATSLVSGADAEVAVDVATAHDVLTVPTSAVHRSGKTTYVTVLRNGRPDRVTVKAGAVGAALTQIRSGVTVGEHVVLASLNAAVPSSSTNLPTGRTGFPGGGFSISRVRGGGPGGGAPGFGPVQSGG